MHVEFYLSGDCNFGDYSDHFYEYQVTQVYTPEVVPPISVGHHIFINDFKDYKDKEEREKKYRGEYLVTKVQHFFSRNQYTMAVFVDRI